MWLRRIAQTYLDPEYFDGNITLWYHDGDQIHTKKSNREDEDHGEWPEFMEIQFTTGTWASGRVNHDTGLGSCSLWRDNPKEQRRVLNDIVNYFSGIRFTIFESVFISSPMSLQSYYEHLVAA